VENKSNRGRPKEYPLDKIKIDVEQLLTLLKFGYTDVQLAEFFKVSEKTINNWKKDPEFLSVLKKGKEMSDERVERSLYERANGYKHPDVHISNYQGNVTITPIIKYYPPEVVACIYWLNNRKSDKWSNRPLPDPDSDIDNKLEFKGFD
jgi:cell fate (sporulation/competence/biofilm development) regulator YmcA (YheA/YmcA/DUF963 family)